LNLVKNLVEKPEAEAFVIVGSSHPKKLGKDIVESLKRSGVRAVEGSFFTENFKDGELYVRLNDAGNLKGRNVFVIQTIHTPWNPDKRHLLELLQLVSAAVAHGARVHWIAPYYAYGRQERVTLEGEAKIAQTIYNALKGAGAHSISSVDVHAPHAMPRDLLNALPTELWIKELNKLKLDSRETVVFACDKGAKPRAEKLAKAFECQLAGANKTRRDKERKKCEFDGFYGSVAGKNVVIPDDIASTFGTLCEVARRLKEMGARDVYAFPTHLVGAKEGWKNLKESFEESVLKKVIVTDSLPLKGRKLDAEDAALVKKLLKKRRLSVVSIAPLLAEIIAKRVEKKTFEKKHG